MSEIKLEYSSKDKSATLTFDCSGMSHAEVTEKLLRIMSLMETQQESKSNQNEMAVAENALEEYLIQLTKHGIDHSQDPIFCTAENATLEQLKKRFLTHTSGE